MAWLVDDAIAERVARIELPWNRLGIDPYGVSQREVARMMTVLSWLYRRYFTVRVFGAERVPARGRAMLVGNHSGGVAVDGAMVIASMFLEREPPRLAQGMIEKFIGRMPVAGLLSSRTGQFPGTPENAAHLLEDDRLLMVFPEGARGTAKLYGDRNTLVAFGTGFARLAAATRTPIVPFAFLGGGDAVPTIANLYRLGRLIGVPYVPITPYLLPIPRRVPLEIYYDEPIRIEGTGNEDDEVVHGWVDRVVARIADLLERGQRTRLAGGPPEDDGAMPGGSGERDAP